MPNNQCIDGYDGFRPKMRPENSVKNPDSAVGATPKKLHNFNGLRTSAGGFSARRPDAEGEDGAAGRCRRGHGAKGRRLRTHPKGIPNGFVSDVRFGPLADISTGPKNGLLLGVKRTSPPATPVHSQHQLMSP